MACLFRTNAARQLRGAHLVCLGLIKDGPPKHPLYVRDQPTTIRGFADATLRYFYTLPADIAARCKLDG